MSPAALRRCDPARRVLAVAGEALGTSWRVRLAAPSRFDLASLTASIERRLAGIVAEMSQWEPASLLSRFNRSPAGTAFTLPPDFAAVIGAALAIARQTDGAFDPTHGRAAALLGHGAATVASPPTADALDTALATAGWRRLRFDASTRRLEQPGGLWLDLSGIAKGYAVDALADMVAAQGCDDALVEIGGELAGRGLRPDGRPWWVDLEPPPGARLTPLRIGLHDLAVATSGDYVRGAHTLDPRTGRPLAAGVVAVSVVHSRAMIADAWATALTVLGHEEGPTVATRENIAARFVVRRANRLDETLSPALAAMLA